MIALWIALGAVLAVAAIGAVLLFRGLHRALAERQSRAQIAQWEATTQKYVQDPIRDLSERHEALFRDLHKGGAE